jgi:eukaryotic-like serine/threonine-protein kinase
MGMVEGQSVAVETSGTVYPLGKYIVLAELGRGGMAEVYLALSRGRSGFSKLVVLKLLRSHLAEDEDFLRMFLAEARLAALLNHPNVVQTYEIGAEGGRDCIVMEYLEGCSFAEIAMATRKSPMPTSLGLRVIADALAGLHHAHSLCDVNGQPVNLVHRDVSPHNVFVTYDGQVKVVDFGIAKASDDGARTKTGVFKGKLRYTAPERFFRGEECDRRSDVFSVGVMLWQVLTKKGLWAGMSDLVLMQQLASRVPVPSPRSIDPTVPAILDAICMKAVAISPDDRFQTAAEMQDAIEEYLASESMGGTNRSLAKFMGEVFGEKRQKFQRTVDEQLRAAANVPLDLQLTPSVARLRAQAVPLMISDEVSDSLSNVALPISYSRVIGGGQPVTLSSPRELDPVLSISIGDAADDAVVPRSRRGVVALAIGGGVAALATILAVVVVLGRTPVAARENPAPGATTMTDVAPTDRPGATPASATVPEGPTAAAPLVVADPGAAPKRAPGAPPSGAWRYLGARARSSVPVGVDTRVAPLSQEAPPQKREADCASPYFIDAQGMKRIRSECL